MRLTTRLALTVSSLSVSQAPWGLVLIKYTRPVPDSEVVRETSKRVDAMTNELKQTTYTVNEMDRHVVRCRRDVDDLVANFGENIAKECDAKVDAKVAELHKKMEAFERTLQRSCDQAAQHADAQMQELVEKHNAKVQELNEHLRERLAEVEKIVGEKATRAEVAALSTEHAAAKKRLEISTRSTICFTRSEARKLSRS